MTVPTARVAETPSAFVRPPHLNDLWDLLPADEAAEIEQILARLITRGGLRLTVGNLKGGVGKSTSSVYLALLLGLTGLPVLIVDADPTNHSVVVWSSVAENWPDNVRVRAWANNNAKKGPLIDAREMERRIAAAAPKFPFIVIDTGPQLADYLGAALRSMRTVDDADGTENGGVLIVPTSPDPLDITQIGDTLTFAANVEAATGTPFDTIMLVTKGKTGTTLAREAYELFAGQELSHFDTMVRNLVSYPQSTGMFPPSFGDYVGVLRELVDSQVD